MEKKRRFRAPNFTSGDNLLLCDIVKKYRHVIENKKTDGLNLRQKQKAWLEVMKEYNSNTSGCTRTVESLQQTYKNLKKKAKKKASDSKMGIPVDRTTLDSSIEEYGTSARGWEKIAENTGISEQKCQETFAVLSKEANTKENCLNKNTVVTGGGPPPNDDNDPVLERVKVLVGPVIDRVYTIYDGDSSNMASRNIPTIKVETMELDPLFEINNSSQMTKDDAQNNEEILFTSDTANLKKKPHDLLTRKQRLQSEVPAKQTVSDKCKKLATAKMELVDLQTQLLRTQLDDEKEKLEHNRTLRAMEMEEMKRKYEHNEKIRKLELERFSH